VGLTVLIVDDHAGFRAAARALLRAEGFVVVGEAEDGASALARTRVLRPRLVLLDIGLPDLDGFTVCERLRAEPDPPLVVLTSTRSASSFRRRLAQSPARGFIWKGDLTGAAIAALVEGA
jgi:DNA-binding NarL/FixJ family response regulator